MRFTNNNSHLLWYLAGATEHKGHEDPETGYANPYSLTKFNGAGYGSVGNGVQYGYSLYGVGRGCGQGYSTFGKMIVRRLDRYSYLFR